MQSEWRRHGLGYLLAVVLTVAATLLGMAIGGPPGHIRPLFLFIVVVVAAAFWGGLRPGLLATVLGFCSALYFFIEPPRGIFPISQSHQLYLALFVGICVLISWLYETLHATRRRLAQNAEEQNRARREAEIWQGRYEAAVNASGSILYDYSITDDKVLLGGSCESILGYTAEELGGTLQSWVARIHPEDRQVFLDEVQRSQADGSKYHAEYRMIGKDGRVVWMEDDGYFVPSQSASGRPEQIIGLIKDVTRQRQSEQEMAQLSQRLTPLIGNTPLAVIEWDADFRITRWSGQAQRTYGWTAEEALGRSIESLGLIDAEDWPRVQAEMDRLCDPTDKFVVFRTRNRTKEGEAIHGEWYNSVLHDAENRVVAILSLILDVTQREQTEAALREGEHRFRQLTDAMPQLVWIADGGGMVRHYNSQVAAFHNPQGDPNEAWHPTIHPEDDPPTRSAWQAAVKAGRPYQCQHRLLMADGTYRWHLSRAVPFVHAGGGGTQWFGTSTDIHDLKVSQEALRESEGRFQAFMDNDPSAVFLKDEEGRFVFVNRQMERLFGRPAEQWIGKTDLDLFEPELAAKFRADDQRVLQSGETLEIEEIVTDGQGEHHYLTYKFPVERQGTRMLGGISLDMTERKRAELRIAAERERVQLLADAVPALIAYIDSGAHYQMVNRVYERWFGHKKSEIRGGHIRDVLGDEAWKVIAPYIDQVLSGQTVTYEAEVPYRDGGTRWVESTYTPDLGERGEVRGFVGHVNDITARKRAETELNYQRTLLQAITDNAQTSIFLIDSQGEVLFVNPAAEEMTGYRRDQMVGRILHDLVHPPRHDDGSPYLIDECPIRRGLKTAASLRNQEDKFLHPGGHLYPVRWNARVVGGDDDSVATVIEVWDISKEKQVEQELRWQAQKLQEADRRKDEFLATLAHELRNPLAPIRTGLELMRMAHQDPAVLEQTRGVMERQTKQLITLVDDLLDLSRITRGKLELRKCQVPLTEVAQIAVEAARPGIELAQHQLSVSLPDEPIYLQADPNRLAQVLSNLLNNAAKYTPSGGQIEFSAQRQGSDVLLSVRDNGIGIPAEMQEHIFDMFAQIDHPLERGATGLGIGLTLVKSLVEMHGGRIEVRSEGVDQGSTFSVRLPMIVEPSVDVRQRVPFVESPQAHAPLKVLVVDDNQEAAEMLAQVIQLLGNEVRQAGDGLEALKVADQFRPDAVIMDIGMPRMNGYEAAKAMRQQPWGGALTLVALTGWGQEEDKRRTKEAGFDHHLVKPADPTELERLLHTIKQGSAELG